MNISKITLCTVQIAMNYGIANEIGKPDFNSSINLLKYAWNNGINTFDTSPKYGNSEEIIGSFVSTQLDSDEYLSIVSKLPKINKIEEMSRNTL